MVKIFTQLNKPSTLHWQLTIFGIGLVLLHLILTWKLVHQTDQFVLSLLFWQVIISLVWQRRSLLNLESNWFSTLIGFILITLMLLKSISLFWFETSFVRLLPGIIYFSLGLITSGGKLKQYWREGVLLLALIVPQGLVFQGLQLAIGYPVQSLTTQMATFLLHYLGFNVIRQDTIIILSNGAVEVRYACTGVPILIVLLQLAVLFLMTSPLPRRKQLGMIGLAIAIAFLLSSIRVALMATVAHDSTTFAYWHGPAGSQLFSTIGIVVFAGSYHLLANVKPTVL